MCMSLNYFVHTFKKSQGEDTCMKMTKDESKILAKKMMKHSKKYGIPLKSKKKKNA